MEYTNILADVELCTSEVGYRLFGFLGYILNFIQIAVPIIIILWGTFDLVKAMTSQEQDKIKKSQSTFIKRLIAGVVVFFVPMIVTFLINMVNGNDGTGQVCLQSFANPSDAMKKADEMKKKNIFGGSNTSREKCVEQGGIYIADSDEAKLYGFNCLPLPSIDANDQVQPTN